MKLQSNARFSTIWTSCRLPLRFWVAPVVFHGIFLARSSGILRSSLSKTHQSFAMAVSRTTHAAGDVVEVLPGDRFSVDGVIIAGFTAADESSITGEATPVPKGPGDVVLAGTCSAADGGAVTVKTTATGAKSVMASVIALVEDAQVRLRWS